MPETPKFNSCQYSSGMIGSNAGVIFFPSGRDVFRLGVVHHSTGHLFAVFEGFSVPQSCVQTLLRYSLSFIVLLDTVRIVCAFSESLG